jgi:hypothetical protein
VFPHLAGSKPPGMPGNSVCETRQVQHLAWSIATRPARRTRKEHSREARGQGVGQLYGTKAASEHHPVRTAMAADVEGRELAKGKAGHTGFGRSGGAPCTQRATIYDKQRGGTTRSRWLRSCTLSTVSTDAARCMTGGIAMWLQV